MNWKPREFRPSYHFMMPRAIGESVGNSIHHLTQAGRAVEWLTKEFGPPGVWQYRNWLTDMLGCRPIIQQNVWTWKADAMAEIYYFRFQDKRTAIRFKARFDAFG